MVDTFGSRFKGLRKDLGLTQEELAKEFNAKYFYNFTKSSVSMYENNKQTPEIDVLQKWSDFFKVSVDYLLGNTELIKGNKIPNELKALGVKYIEVVEKAKDYDISAEELEELVEAINRMKKKK